MKQRIFAILLVLALVIATGAVAVFASEGVVCPECKQSVTWTKWDGKSNITETGHYFLEDNVTDITAEIVISSGANVVLDLQGKSLTSTARVFNVASGATFTLMDSVGNGVVTGTAGGNVGATVYVSNGTSSNGTVFNLYNATLSASGTISTNGGVLSLGAYSTVNMYSGTINSVNNSSKNGNAIYMVQENSTFNMNGGTISAHASAKANRGGAIYRDGNATTTVFNLYDGKITGGKAGRGGAIFARKATINMSGGEISGGIADSTGHVVCLYADNGKATFNMTGGKITSTENVTADTSIGVLYNYSQACNISGGEIVGNIVSNNSTVTLSKDPVIENIVSGTIVIGSNGLSSEAFIGVTVAENAVLTTVTDGNAEEYAKCFHTNSFRGKAEADATGNITMVADTACPHCNGAPWVAYTGQTASGHYYLSEDKAVAGQFSIGDNDTSTENEIVLDLYGHTFNDTTSRFSVREGVKLYLLDSGVDGEMIGHRTDDHGGVISLRNGAHFPLYSGKVTDGATTARTNSCGGAIGHDSTATNCSIVIKGGTVTGNSAKDGAAIWLSGATHLLTIEGGTIIGGTATNGGTIAVTGGATFTMTGGEIIGGTATYGGAVYVNASTANISQGTVSGGVAKHGGAVYVTAANGSLTMTGGIIQNGKTQIGATDNYGGNLYLGTGATANISGGTIKDGTAYANGGNIFQHQNAGTLTISGDAVISGGMTTYYEVTNGALTTTLQDSTNTNYGGGNVYVYATTTISGNAQIIGSEKPVTNCGANVYVRGTLNINGGTITGGDATYQGDCIAVRNTNKINVSGGTIDGIAVIRSDANNGSTITVSGAPTIGYIDLTSYTTDTAYDITLGTLSNGASIGIIAASNEPFTVVNADLVEASKGYFHDASNAQEVGVVDNCLILGKKCPHCGEYVAWVDWAGTALNTADANDVHYVLTKSLTGGNSQTAIGAANVNVNVVIDLNGYEISRQVSASGVRVFAVYGGSTLNLVNTSSTESVVTGTKLNDVGGTINLSDSSNLNLYDNVKLVHAGQSEYEKNGGVVRVVDGTFKMHGGSITGDSAEFGGAVAVNGIGSFVMNKGVITGGTATRGGAVYVDNGSFIMNDGTINGGTASWGGTVCLVDSTVDEYATTFTMNGGVINGGTATRGAAIYAQNNNPVITIENGTVNGGIINSNDGGGTIGLGSGTATLNLNGGVINGSQLTAEAPRGGTAICNFASSSTLNMNGGTINGYEGGTTAKGGAIYSDGRVIYTAGTINGCASAAGDVMYFGTTSAELIMTLADNDAAMEAFSGKIITVDSDDVTADAGYMVNDTEDVGTWYKDIATATANYVDGGYLSVLTDDNITVDGLTVDVNGHSITVSGTSACIDTSNDGYDSYAVVTMDSLPNTYTKAANGLIYITVAEGNNQYSFHRLRMEITEVNLRPSVGGVYYTATWNADNVLAGDLNATSYDPIVLGYGIALTKGDVPLENFETQGAFTYFDNIEGFTNRFLSKTRGTKINSCVLKNIVTTGNSAEQNAANANTVINAAPFVYFVDYTGKLSCVFGDNNGAWKQGRSFKDIVDYAAGYAKLLTGDEQTAFVADLQKLYDTWFAGTENYKLGEQFSEELYTLLNPAGA